MANVGQAPHTLFIEVIKTTTDSKKPAWKQTIEYVELSHLPTCDYCGRPANPLFIFGATDCKVTFKLCLAHRNMMIQDMYIKVANHRAQVKIAEAHRRAQAAEEKYMDEITRGAHR